MLGNVKWPLVGYIIIYLGLLVLRNSPLKYSAKEFLSANQGHDVFDNRKVDISDSRLSNVDSASSDRELDTGELLTVDRVFPLTRTLNRVMDKTVRKFNLLVTLDDKKILSLQSANLNLTYLDDENDNETERRVFGRNAFLSRLDTLKRLGNAYVAEDTDTKIVLVQKLQFQILKQSYDFYDIDSSHLGGCSFIYNNNVFLLSTELSTSYDNSECRIKSVNLNYEPNQKSLTLRVEGLSGTEGFYKKLESTLYANFISKVIPAIEHEVLPILTKLVFEADVCSLFDAQDNYSSNNNLNNNNNSKLSV